MMLSDPSFERSHRGEHYALYFKMEMSWGYANNYDYRFFLIIYSQYFSKVFVKDHGRPTII